MTLEGWELFARVAVALLGMAATDLGIAFVMRGHHETSSELHSRD